MGGLIHLKTENVLKNIVVDKIKLCLEKAGYTMERLNCFELFTERLRDYSEGNIWTDGNEILCKTESASDAIADMLETLYKTQGEEIKITTGYYDPEEDKRNHEEDKYTGWWYVTIP